VSGSDPTPEGESVDEPGGEHHEPRPDPNANWSANPSNEVWAIISYLLGGMIVWGGAGLLLDAWLGTGFFLPAGLLLGAGAALYLIWVRYGKA
jgi:ATP synthase protein I